MIVIQYFLRISKAHPSLIGGSVHGVWMTSEAVEVTRGKPASSSSLSKWGGVHWGATAMLVNSSTHVYVLFLSSHDSPLPFFIVSGHVELVHLLVQFSWQPVGEEVEGEIQV